MKSETINIVRYDADEGMVFDWAEPRFDENEYGTKIIQHLYAKTLFIGKYDSIDNYIEVTEPVEED